jgi:hypothetical protein
VNDTKQIRASALPKLALCGQFEGATGEASEAAQRGTRIDALMRHMWETGEIPNGADMEEVKVAHWAVSELLRLSQNPSRTKTTEEHCKVHIPIIDYTGTMDAVNYQEQWLADLKTGQVANYREQMAAYALGCMDCTGVDIWTAYLLFADQQIKHEHTFTRHQAEQILREVVANTETSPKENEYCGWCAKSLTCPARTDSALSAASVADIYPSPQAPWFLELLDDPHRLGVFLTQCTVLDDFRDAAKVRALEMLESRADVPGWRLQKGRVTETVSVETQLEYDISPRSLIKAHGALSAKKFRELVAEGTDFPVETKTSKPSLVKTK